MLSKDPITTDYGFTILDNIVVSHDWIDVRKLLLKTLESRLSDAYGKTIDLRGAPISFPLIFMDKVSNNIYIHNIIWLLKLT